MTHLQPIEYGDAEPSVRDVYEDIKHTRNVEDVNNFWKVLAHHPATLKRTWESTKEVMAPGALDPMVKEMIYVSDSVTNNCEYSIRSHTAGALQKGMTDDMFGKLIAVVGLANETDSLVNSYHVPLDESLKD